jgi:hypothetical protein
MSEPSQGGEIHRSPPAVRIMTGVAVLGSIAFLASLFTQHRTNPIVNKAVIYTFYTAWIAAAAGFLVFRIADLARHRKWRRFDAWSYFPALVLIMVIMAGALHLPFMFRRDVDRESNQAAQSAGARAELAQKRYFAEHETYTKDLGELMKIDPAITRSREVTFKFDQADQSGYRFSTHYNRSRFTYRYADKGVAIFKNLKPGPPPESVPGD